MSTHDEIEAEIQACVERLQAPDVQEREARALYERIHVLDEMARDAA